MTGGRPGAGTEPGARLRPRRQTAAPATGQGRVLFIGVPLDAAARDAVAALVASLPEPANARPVRWVRLDGLHLTLRFLGPTPDERIPAIESALDAATAGELPFRVSLRGAGAFPSVRRPRALWLGVAAGTDDLTRAAGRLDDALAAEGWPRDTRPYRAHLTLARSDGVRAGPATASALAAAAATFRADFIADRIVLFESLKGSGPARYEPVAERPLGHRRRSAVLPSASEPSTQEPPLQGNPDRP